VPLGQLRAELTFAQEQAGITIHVDVEAAEHRMNAAASQGRTY
jgi:hypothetical protein